MSQADSVPRLLDCIARLRHRDQDLLLDLVNLLCVAEPAIQTRARSMIGEVLKAEPRSHLECVAVVRHIVEYLETSIERQDPAWVPPLWRESIVPIPD